MCGGLSVEQSACVDADERHFLTGSQLALCQPSSATCTLSEFVLGAVSQFYSVFLHYPKWK